MSEHPAVQAAMERGAASAALVVKHRDALIEHMAALILITGKDGLRACASGACEAVIAAQDGIVWGELTRPRDEARP